jgi:hypothetical protein
VRFAVFGITVFSQAADLITSWRGLSRGAIEMNPMIHTQGDLVLVKVLAALTVVLALLVAGRFSPRAWGLVSLAAVGLAGVTLGAAANNLMVSP